METHVLSGQLTEDEEHCNGGPQMEHCQLLLSLRTLSSSDCAACACQPVDHHDEDYDASYENQAYWDKDGVYDGLSLHPTTANGINDVIWMSE